MSLLDFLSDELIPECLQCGKKLLVGNFCDEKCAEGYGDEMAGLKTCKSCGHKLPDDYFNGGQTVCYYCETETK